jgi:hypothetical protein
MTAPADDRDRLSKALALAKSSAILRGEWANYNLMLFIMGMAQRLSRPRILVRGHPQVDFGRISTPWRAECRIRRLPASPGPRCHCVL